MTRRRGRAFTRGGEHILDRGGGRSRARSRTRSGARGVRAALVAAALVLGGCGYTAGSMMPGGVRSVAVRLFDNESNYRNAEETYTRALARELARRAQVVIRDAEDADAVIEGRIVHVSRNVLVEDERDQLLEGGVFATVEVQMVDPRTGRPLVRPFQITRRAEHIEPRGETLESAIDEVLLELAEDTVVRLQGMSFVEERYGADAVRPPPAGG